MADQFENSEEATKRPSLITVFAILTLINSAFFILWEMVLRHILPLEFTNDEAVPLWMRIVVVCVLIIKGAAAILLLSMKKIGFYIYASAETANALLVIIGGKMAIDLADTYVVNQSAPVTPELLVYLYVGVSIAFSIVWIGGYGSHLSKMDQVNLPGKF